MLLSVADFRSGKIIESDNYCYGSFVSTFLFIVVDVSIRHVSSFGVGPAHR